MHARRRRRRGMWMSYPLLLAAGTYSLAVDVELSALVLTTPMRVRGGTTSLPIGLVLGGLVIPLAVILVPLGLRFAWLGAVGIRLSPWYAGATQWLALGGAVGLGLIAAVCTVLAYAHSR